MFNLFINTKQPTAGAESYAIANRRVPKYYVTANGQSVQRTFYTSQPQQNFTFQQIPVAGIGGLIHGTLYGGQLSLSPFPLPKF